jgi:hypothetical protein
MIYATRTDTVSTIGSGLIVGRAKETLGSVEAVPVIVGLDILERSTAHDLTGLETPAVYGPDLDVPEEICEAGSSDAPA